LIAPAEPPSAVCSSAAGALSAAGLLADPPQAVIAAAMQTVSATARLLLKIFFIFKILP
jgi:hypothetical protein